MSKGSGTSGHGSGGGAALAALDEMHFASNYDVPESEDKAAFSESESLRSRLDFEEIRAIDRYTEEGYKGIRAAAMGEKGVSDRDYTDALALHRALKKATKVERTVYRGMALTERDLGKILKSKSFHIQAPTSATRDVVMAQEFVKNSYHRTDKKFGVVLRIKQKSGAAIDSLSSQGMGEREILIPRGVKLKVERMQRTTVKMGMIGTLIPTLVIHATEI